MWKDWTEPLEVLLTKAQVFLKQIDFADFPRSGVLIEPPELYTRKKRLAEAFTAYIDNVVLIDHKTFCTLAGCFLRSYVYTSSVYEDALDFVFEYIGECEHQFGLHDEEDFAPTKEALIKDFALYIENWVSYSLSSDA